MRCPNCQTLNLPTAKFCMECGNRLLVCPNCQTVNLPEAKFCIECGRALAEQTRTSYQTQPLPESRTLEANGVQALPAPATALTVPGANAQTHPGASQISEPEERRVVTIMFADITGSTPLADRLDPEDMRAILAGYFNLMAEQIRRHGGTVEKYIGDAVMAVFGAPVAHEDDPDRAIRAALDMQAALNHFNSMRLARDSETTRLQMRIGINTGEVAAPGARSQRQDFLITGDAVNVAARLQQVATPDTILIGERTYLAVREVFEFRSLAPIQVKGKALPLNAWLVLGLRSRDLAIVQHPRGIDGLQTPLVGRSLELMLIHATYARVRDAHHPHLITLLGSPGIGKSRLIREFIEREETAARCTTCDDIPVEPRVLKGHCPPYGEGITYWPLVEILRSLIHVRDGESGETLEQRFVEFVRDTLRKAKRADDIDQVANVLLHTIGRGLRGDDDAQERRDIQRGTHTKDIQKGGPLMQLQRACRVLFESIAQVQPLILVIDDLQWADEALLKLLEYLTGRISDVPILFLCLARPDFLERRREWSGGQPNFTTIILDALTRDETAELIGELLSTSDLPDVLLYTIQRRAEGNPFFVEEIVRMLIDQGVLVKNEHNGMWSISSQSGDVLSELASPATPPEDTLLDRHYILPLPRLPDTIQGVLAARVDLLSQVEKQVLQCASIVGRTFWLSAVLELAENLERHVVLRTLEQLIQRDFIEESEKQARGPIEDEESFSFKHILIRDVVYNNIPRYRRSHKHAQLALWLEERVADRLEIFADLLAYHYQQALANWAVTLHVHTIHAPSGGPDHEAKRNLLVLTRAELTERAIRYLTLAGDKAYRGYYTIRAIQAYTEALDLLDSNEADELTLSRMHQKLGHAYTQRTTVDDAWAEYITALKLIEDQPAVERNDLLCCYLHLAELGTRWWGWFEGDLDMREVRSYIDKGLKLLEGEPPSADLAELVTYLSMWYVREFKPAGPEQRQELADHALKHALEGLHIAEEAQSTISTWIALDALGFIYGKQHKYAEAHMTQHRRQSLHHLIKHREELYDLYSSLGGAHALISDYPTAVSWFGQAWQLAQTMESPSMLLSSMLGRLRVWEQWNRYDEAREVATSILQISEQYQQPDKGWQLSALEALAEVAYRTGNVEESEEFLGRYQHICEHYCPNKPMLLPAIHAVHENWPLALADMREIVRRAEPFPLPEALAHQAEFAVLAGQPVEEQQDLCARAVRVGEESGARKYFAIALRARGRMQLELASWDEAEKDLRRALAGFKELDLPWEQGETLTCLGQLHCRLASQSARDQTAHAKHSGLASFFLQQALGFFEAQHAVHDARRVRAMLAGAQVGV
ncbi:MAG TPA: adenylate/guanylate cyclase domain-containing protein [Ktedonobacteraceae bacterium]